MTIYKDKIDELFGKMFALRSSVHPANRVAVDEYLHAVWQDVARTTMSFESYHPSDSLSARFQDYVDAEEERLKKNLENFHYDIDAMDTLALITGPGRIEKVSRLYFNHMRPLMPVSVPLPIALSASQTGLRKDPIEQNSSLPRRRDVGCI